MVIEVLRSKMASFGHLIADAKSYANTFSSINSRLQENWGGCGGVFGCAKVGAG